MQALVLHDLYKIYKEGDVETVALRAAQLVVQPMAELALQTRNLTRSYRLGRETIRALDDVNLAIRPSALANLSRLWDRAVAGTQPCSI